VARPNPALPDDLQATVMIPTVGDPALVLPCVQRLLETTVVTHWQLMLVVNPVPATAPSLPMLRQQVEATVQAFNVACDGHVELHWLELPAAAGWTGAVNAGVRWLLQEGMPGCVVVMNDDVLVTPSWLARMGNALDPQKVLMQGEVGMHGNDAPPRDPAGFGRVGMVGPCSNEVAGVQKVQAPEVRMANGAAFINDGATMLDRFSADFTKKANPYPMAAAFLSGLCTLYRRECLLDLLMERDEGWCLLDPVYGTGGYDDNDACQRAALAGWRKVVATTVYVHHLGHQTLDVHFPEAQRGLANAPTYLRAWEHATDKDHRLVAVYRVAWEVPWDVLMLGKSLRAVAQLADAVALLATSSPAAVTSSPAWKAAMGQLPPPEAQLVAAAADAGDDHDKLTAALDLYLLAVTGDAGHPVEVAAGVWDGEWNERDERNAAIQLGMQLRPDWLLSVDHDEVPEDRITRAHVQRLMRHPDPSVTHYDMGWLNHWDSPRLMRVDAPWAHGYSSSMRGFRLWRVQHPAFQQILGGNEKGLHCGNVPDAGESSKRVAAFRFRHYGYLRPEDRLRKHNRYQRLDPEPDAVLTQAAINPVGGYSHLVNEEGMQMQPYHAANGIGLTMLWHAGESLHDLMRWLDLTYGMVDQCVLVWTGPEDTAPSPDMQYVAQRFGARWTHHPMADDLAAARNAGVDALRELGVTWCWVMDPDEHLAPPFPTLVAMRRMAEVTDSWAWMFRFRNHRPDGQFNWSENTRLFRLADGVLRFGNRVHETLEAGLAQLGSMGIHPNVRFAPFHVEHFGLNGGDAKTQQKLRRYTRLLALQLQDDPLRSPGAWVSLGLQYGNDGLYDEQWQCYEMALRTAGHGYLPFREAALYHLRKGRHLMAAAHERLSPAHQLHGPVGQLVDVLSKQAPDQPLLGKARGGGAVPPDVDLPALLAHAHATAEGAGLVQPTASVQQSLAAPALDAAPAPGHDGAKEERD